ncbi:acyl-CoA thioesterase [Aegicerativicinus sediminis]
MNDLFEIEKIRVQFNETDALGIVWHGNYLKYFEAAREAFGRKYNMGYNTAKKNGFATPIVKSSVEHKLPLHFDEVFSVRAIYIPESAAKLKFRYEIRNEQNQLVCIGQTTQVFTDLSSGELSLVNPEFYDQWKLRYNV